MHRCYQFLQQINGLMDHARVLEALRNLAPLEQAEWSHLLLLKCQELHNRGLTKQLKQTLSLLVQGCSQLRMQERLAELQELIVLLYSEEDYARFMPLLRQLGFNTRTQETLEYKEGFMTSLWYGIKDFF